MIAIKPCEKDSDFLLVKQLVKDYIRWLNIDLSFQAVDKELSDLSSMYGPPNGIFLLAWYEDKLAGGVGLRALAPGVCEMKRLYVYDQFKNKGIGRRLCTALIQEARGGNSGDIIHIFRLSQEFYNQQCSRFSSSGWMRSTIKSWENFLRLLKRTFHESRLRGINRTTLPLFLTNTSLSSK